MIATTEKSTGTCIEASLPSHAEASATRARIRVWLTDDNASFRNSLAWLLSRSGEFDCEREFPSAESLLEGLQAGPAPEVILLDVEMGGMTGVEALRPIRACAPNVRVLIVTSFFDPVYDAQASRDGASAFLIKADTPQNLVAEIHRALAAPVKRFAVTEAAMPKPKAETGPLPSLEGQNRLGARLIAWLSNLPATLFGQMPFHRPAPTPD